MSIDLYDYLARVEVKKRAFGIEESEKSIDALRNKGDGRTVGKRALLREAARRASQSGRPFPRTYF